MENQPIKFILLLPVVLIAVLFLSGCSLGSEWTGFYYSDINRMSDESTWRIQPGLGSLEECRNWVNTVHKPSDNYDYECGYRCRYDKDINFTVCKETKE